MKMAAGSPESGAALHAWACSLCKLQVYAGGMGGYGTLTLLKQLATPALEALNALRTLAKPPLLSEHAGFDLKYPAAQMLNSAEHSREPYTNYFIGMHLPLLHLFSHSDGGLSTFSSHSHLAPAFTHSCGCYTSPSSIFWKNKRENFPFESSEAPPGTSVVS